MEADSTTYDTNPNDKDSLSEIHFPFTTCPENLQFYKQLISRNGERLSEIRLVHTIQEFGLLATSVRCPSNLPECNVICKHARVIDRVQWICEGCGKRQPIRTGSFFFRLQCSILQTLQLILAWCEDADLGVAAQHFDVKPKVANSIFERLDELAIKALRKQKLGGENAVVLTEIYPDCLNRLSPDTTDQPHVHRILMLADTKHIPTKYRLHVIKQDLRKPLGSNMEESLIKSQLEEVLTSVAAANSALVTGNNVPFLQGTSSLQHLLQYCDVDMRHFMSSRIWSQAISLCAASRDLCTGAGAGAGAGAGTGAGAGACGALVQRYLDAALYRLAHARDFYQHMLRLVAAEFTDKAPETASETMMS